MNDLRNLKLFQTLYLSDDQHGFGSERVNLEFRRVLDGEVFTEPGNGWNRIAVELHFESRALVFEHATRLDLFGEERRFGRFHRSLHDALLSPGFVFHFRRLRGRNFACDLQLTFDFLLRLFLSGHVHLLAVNGRFKRLRWNSAALGVDVNFRSVSFAGLPHGSGLRRSGCRAGNRLNSI